MPEKKLKRGGISFTRRGDKIEATYNVPASELPEGVGRKRITAHGATEAEAQRKLLAKFSGGSELQITVGENLGFGSLLGLEGKYQEACDFMLNEVLMNVKVAESAAVSDATAIKVCPFCAEEVKAAAVRCKHCGSDI